MAFAKSDAERLLSDNSRTISIASSGPSGVAIKEKSRINRAKRYQHRPGQDSKDMIALPFESSSN